MKSFYYCPNTVDILKSSAYKLSENQQWGRKNIDYNEANENSKPHGFAEQLQ